MQICRSLQWITRRAFFVNDAKANKLLRAVRTDRLGHVRSKRRVGISMRVCDDRCLALETC